MKLIVSLVGDQTLPNVEFILARPPADLYLFLETKKTKEAMRSDDIMLACGLREDQVRFILVDPNHLVNILGNFGEKVKKAGITLSEFKQIEINISGGTKMMSLAAYNFFREIPGASIHYIPVNEQMAYPVWPESNLVISIPDISLETYLSAYGYSIGSCESPKSTPEKCREIFASVIRQQHPGIVDSIRNAVSPAYDQPDKQYYTGGWFEEWLYFGIQEAFAIPDENIAMNLKLLHADSQLVADADNEIDVAFLYRNKLHLIEAKVYPGEIKNKKIYDPMYKIAAIQKSLGLHAITHVFILHPFGNGKNRHKRIEDRRRILGISRVWSLEEIASKSIRELII